MTGTYPRLRTRTRRRKSGKVVVYYFYDASTEGSGEIPLATDFDKAIVQWKEVTENGPHSARITGTLEKAFSR